MRRVTTENQEYLRGWISDKLGGEAPFDTQCIGIDVDGEVKAVVSYSNFAGKSCNFSMVGEGKNWMNKDFLWAMFDYPFNKLGLKVILATISGNNDKSLNMCRKLGFQKVVQIADAHKDGDLVIFEMRKDGCKWLQLDTPLKRILGV